MVRMAYKVYQWSGGNVGRHTARVALERESLELVGMQYATIKDWFVGFVVGTSGNPSALKGGFLWQGVVLLAWLKIAWILAMSALGLLGLITPFVKKSRDDQISVPWLPLI